MMTTLYAINWWAVIALTLFTFVLGAIWYGPLFGKVWLRLIEKKAEDLQTSSTMYCVPPICALISTTALAVLIHLLGIDRWLHGLITGGIVWAAFAATGLLTTGIFENKKPSLTWLFTGYMVIAHAVSGAVLVIW